MKAIPLDLRDVTWNGPEITDPKILRDLPEDHFQFLRQLNGFVLSGGALHVRGAVLEPEWHSIRKSWRGKDAFHELYDEVLPGDIPFAEDLFGDQFFLRRGAVWRLFAETGELEPMTDSFADFLEGVDEDAEGFLNVPGGNLEPGQLMLAYPPFCLEESGKESRLSVVPAAQAIAFHAQLARQLKDVPEGAKIKFNVEG